MTITRAEQNGVARLGRAMLGVVLAVGLSMGPSLIGLSPTSSGGRVSGHVGFDLLHVEAPFTGVPANGWAGTPAPTFESGPRSTLRADLEGTALRNAGHRYRSGRLPFGVPTSGLPSEARPRTPRGSMLFGLPAAPTHAPPHRS